MDGKQFIYLLAEITFYSTLSRKKVKDVEIYSKLGISHSQFGHYKTHETARIPKEVAKLIKEVHQEVLDHYHNLEDPINKLEKPETHLDVNNQNVLLQRIEDMQAMLEAERNAKEANAKIIEMLEEKLLTMLKKQSAAIDKMQKQLDQKNKD